MTRTALVAGLLTAMVACAPAPPLAQTYAEAAILAQSDPVAAARLCRDLPDAMRGECLTLTAHSAAPTQPEAAAAMCDDTPPGFWQDECWFLVAEASVPAVGGQTAAQACQRAGRFRANCLDHVWRAHAGILHGTMSATDAAAAYQPALAWSDGLVNQKPGQLRGRFWQKFYDAPLHDSALPPVDLAWCDSMKAELARECAQRLPAAFRHTLVRLNREHAVQDRPLAPTACASDTPLAERIQAAFGLRYIPHPTLDELAQNQLALRCRAAGHNPAQKDKSGRIGPDASGTGHRAPSGTPSRE